MFKITKAILTGGGRATRLRPITTTINKHLIPLANKPMIFHAIEKVVKAGVQEIFININPGEAELQKVVGDGGRWGVKIEFFEQEGGPQGIAHVVKQAQKFIGDDPFLFYLSDNIILADLSEMVAKFNANNYACMLAFARVPDPERFGVPFFDKQGKLVDVVEKPAQPPNNFAVTGIYLYGPKIFFEAFGNIEKSGRGEYEISSIHSYFLKKNMAVGYQEITGWWKDTGKPDDLLAANSLLLDQLTDDYFTVEEAAGSDAAFNGRVRVGAGVKIGKNVKINGPVIIGKNCVLEDCVINAYTTIGAGSAIKRAEISNSLVFDNCEIDCPIKIANSIIGKGANIIKRESNRTHNLILGDNTVVEM